MEEGGHVLVEENRVVQWGFNILDWIARRKRACQVV